MTMGYITFHANSTWAHASGKAGTLRCAVDGPVTLVMLLSSRALEGRSVGGSL